MRLAALLAVWFFLAPSAGAADPPTYGKAPLIGIHYFDWLRSSSDPPCEPWGAWNGASCTYPFQITTPVRSSVTGTAYDSGDAAIARIHADLFRQLGVDFVIFDQTNTSKQAAPADNFEFLNSLQAIRGLDGSGNASGFAAYTPKKIRVVYLLSLTCWGEICHQCPSGSAAAKAEIFTENAYIDQTIAAIYEEYARDPDRFVRIDGKPILVFYLNGGSNVRTMVGGSCDSLAPAFDPAYAAGLIPSPTQWNPYISASSGSGYVRDLFSVRFALVNFGQVSFDYEQYSKLIWPYRCDYGCTTYEAADASLASTAWSGRDPAQLAARVNQANAAGKPFVLIRSWNEFSSTDETLSSAETLEPNTALEPANPWQMFNEVKKELNGIKAYTLIARHSGKCLDVRGGESATYDGAQLQQWDCLGSRNQVFYTKSFGAGDDWYIVADHSGRCLDVTGGASTNGALIQQYDCLGAAQYNQTFRLVPTGDRDVYTIATKASGYGSCLDVASVSMENGANVQQYQCIPGASNQQWRLVPLNWEMPAP